MGDVRFAADIKVGIAGTPGSFATFVLGSCIAASFCEEALESPGGQLDGHRDILTSGFRRVDIPLKVNDMWRYILSAVAFCGRRGESSRYSHFPASPVAWALSKKRPNLSNCGIHLPFPDSGRCAKWRTLGSERDYLATARELGPCVCPKDGGLRRWQFAPVASF